ncbi:MAG: hormogonium polysaccharide biosynthesis glycosyltransferase HpsP [Elainella sp. Prado103]|nr:hormogonium polysaccharide biosynthesis glycosyltransferase HpsP [Elainella sp. Prado103]
MRILQIVPSLSLVYGGPSQMVLGLSKGLARQGAEVTILTTDANGDRGQAPLDVPLDQAIEQSGYQIRYFRCSPFRRYKFSLGLLRWLHQNIHQYDLAHIHALFSPVSSAAATIARWHHFPYILRPLGTLDPADLQKKKQLKRLYAACLEKPNLAQAAAVHFTSDQEAKVSERFGAVTRDLVMPLGVELPASTPCVDRSQWGIPEGVPVLLFMSRIDPKKGLDLLLPALEQLAVEAVPFQFVLAGANPQDPEYEQQIRSRIQRSSLADRTTITGFVAGEPKTQLLQLADLFVLPSYYENFGIAVAEAMTMGVPVLISDQVHIWPQIAQAEAGWICRCDQTDLTQQLRSALQDPQARLQKGQQAQAYATQHFSWEAIAQSMLAVYQQIQTQSFAGQMHK